MKGPDNDFGIKFNVSNGGPAPESVTNLIYENTKKCDKYYICEMPEVIYYYILRIHCNLIPPNQLTIITFFFRLIYLK